MTHPRLARWSIVISGSLAALGCGATTKETGAEGGAGGQSTVSDAGGASTTPGSGGSADGGSTSSGPGAVTDLQLVRQGGAANDSQPSTSSQSIAWQAPAGGAVDHYQVFRNGTPYAKTTKPAFDDDDAPGSNHPDFKLPATTYRYEVAAVDGSGRMGPKTSLLSAFVYRHGKSNWDNYDLSWGDQHEDYASTAGAPRGGMFDVSIQFIMGGFQPAAHPPQAPIDDLEIGAFAYFVVDVNPGDVADGYEFRFGTVSRLPPGDVFGFHPMVDVFKYGPKPKANTWASYKIPLVDVAMGICTFTGSIKGNKLTVTKIDSGPEVVDAGGFVTGPGVPDGTYIKGYDQNDVIGTFTLDGDGISEGTNVPEATLTFQRTSLYKFAMFPTISTTMYLNDIGFTTE